jgi:hypothetical protein
MQENLLKLWLLVSTPLKIMRCHYYSFYGIYTRGKVRTLADKGWCTRKKNHWWFSAAEHQDGQETWKYGVNFYLFCEQNKCFSVMVYGKLYFFISQSEFI